MIKTTIDFWFVGWSVLLILNILVGVADYFQGGIAWPVNLVAVFGMVILKL